MNVPDRSLACHHLELQKGCSWCTVYSHQSVRQCDRCRNNVNSNLVYLSLTGRQPQLLCIYCHYDEVKWGV